MDKNARVYLDINGHMGYTRHVIYTWRIIVTNHKLTVKQALVISRGCSERSFVK